MSLARVSVLDQTPVSEGMPGRDALANTLDLARAADRLGFHRYGSRSTTAAAWSPAPRPRR